MIDEAGARPRGPHHSLITARITSNKTSRQSLAALCSSAEFSLLHCPERVHVARFRLAFLRRRELVSCSVHCEAVVYASVCHAEKRNRSSNPQAWPVYPSFLYVIHLSATGRSDRLEAGEQTQSRQGSRSGGGKQNQKTRILPARCDNETWPGLRRSIVACEGSRRATPAAIRWPQEQDDDLPTQNSTKLYQGCLTLLYAVCSAARL